MLVLVMGREKAIALMRIISITEVDTRSLEQALNLQGSGAQELSTSSSPG